MSDSQTEVERLTVDSTEGGAAGRLQTEAEAESRSHSAASEPAPNSRIVHLQFHFEVIAESSLVADLELSEGEIINL